MEMSSLKGVFGMTRREGKCNESMYEMWYGNSCKGRELRRDGMDEKNALRVFGHLE